MTVNIERICGGRYDQIIARNERLKGPSNDNAKRCHEIGAALAARLDLDLDATFL